MKPLSLALVNVIAYVQAVKWCLQRRSRKLIVTDAEREIYVQPPVVGRVFETIRFRCWLCYSRLENGCHCACIYFLLFARLVRTVDNSACMLAAVRTGVIY
jgi:hypothetical protein